MGSESGTFGYGTSELTTTTPHTYVYSLHVVTRVHTYAVLTRTQVDLSLSLCHRRTGCYCHRWPLLKREKWGEKICFVEWCVPSVPTLEWKREREKKKEKELKKERRERECLERRRGCFWGEWISPGFFETKNRRFQNFSGLNFWKKWIFEPFFE